MVERNFGLETVDYILGSSELPSGGVYTSVGTYETREMVQLVQSLSIKTGVPVSQLLETYGRYLFRKLSEFYPQFFDLDAGLFSFLSSIHDHIHVEVKKLYPDAELPNLFVRERNEKQIILEYQSPRKLSSLGTGLFLESFDFFREECGIDLSQLDEEGTRVLYTITKK